MQFFILEEARAPGGSGRINATHKWALPGIICPECGVTWGGGSKAYPSVDLSPVVGLADFETPRPEPAVEYERLCELIRPLLPVGAILEPGTGLGPLKGTAQGRFGALVSPYPWWLLARRETVEQLQSAGLRGLKGCRTELRFRQRNPPELLELELLPVGRLHPECLPVPRPPMCGRCGRHGLSLPEARVLDSSSLPQHLDVFRLLDFSTVIVCSEQFVETCRRLSLEGVDFHPVPVR